MDETYKRIIILRSNPVRPDSRVEKEARSLAKAGFSVMILAWDRDSNYFEKKEELEEGSGILITRLGIKASFGAGLKNIKPNMMFQKAMMRYLKQHIDEYDIIHACDFDTAFFSSKVAKRFHKQFVFDVFDFLFCEPENLFQSVIKRAQINLIDYSDATIICTEERRRQIKEANPKKLCVIHNSPPVLSSDKRIATVNDKITIVYVGILQDTRLLVEIGEYFKEHPEYQFHIAGFGKYENHFSSLSSECDNIKYYGRIKYEETLELENKADIMLAIYDPSIDNHRYAAPNKFYESLMLGKPIIMVKGTGMSDVVMENDIGVLIDYSKEGFAKGIKTLVNRQSEWHEITERMRSLYKEKYSWNEMEKRLVDLYKGL